LYIFSSYKRGARAKREIYVFDDVVLPSHVVPVYSGGHVHIAIPRMSIHVPPFRHGTAAQASIVSII
jgi:hypothetical protein